MSKSSLLSLFFVGTLITVSGGQVLAAASAADTYKAKCAMCHGPDGAGSTPLGQRMKIRDLRSADVQKQSDETLTGIVTNGQKAMPGFGKSLDAATIQGLVAFVRSLAAK